MSFYLTETRHNGFIYHTTHTTIVYLQNCIGKNYHFTTQSAVM